MPHLKLTGIKKETAISISTGLINDLEALLACPRDYFTIELDENIYIFDGEITPAPCKITVEWFDRGQEIQDQAAAIITSALRKAGYDALDIYFTHFLESHYYENGKHF